ncbi:MauE/DoxX family redox-associated membrane protein [Cupriavidus sp. WKF15]|uniref:MauE/DoxX family redox-associated membrane protein n=1 Tax=Cupriavidus sp. WKF15 TaxID=3032282 RepID=UPI0023E0AC52|nr:MauE/DoxX family redox-associated membrane protein [Cupriavidus sp. WKF15]WER48400.1 MauE/DoxX family redox-associated membrane protein [Cupriavidus sp. WKF15]
MSLDLICDPVAHGVGRTFLALLFLVGATLKAMAFEEFTGTIAAYRLIPDAAVKAAAMLVVALEAVSGVLSLQLLSVSGGAWVPVGFLGIVTLAVGINLARGNVDIDCGCGVAQGSSRLSWPILARNTVLILVAAGLTAVPAGRALSLFDNLSIAGGAMSLLGVHVAFTQLIANSPNSPNSPVSNTARQHP